MTNPEHRPLSPEPSRNFHGLKKTLALLALLNAPPHHTPHEQPSASITTPTPIKNNELDIPDMVTSPEIVLRDRVILLGDANMWMAEHKQAALEAQQTLKQFPLDTVVRELSQLSTLPDKQLLSRVQLLGIQLYSPEVITALIAESGSNEAQDRALAELQQVFGQVNTDVIKGKEIEAMSLNVGMIYDKVGADQFTPSLNTIAMHELIHAMHTTTNEHQSSPAAEALVKAVQDILITRFSKKSDQSLEFSRMVATSETNAFSELSYGYMLLETAQRVGINGVKELMQDNYAGLFQKIMDQAPVQTAEPWLKLMMSRPPQPQDRGFSCGMQTVLLSRFPVEVRRDIVEKINTAQQHYRIVLIDQGGYQGMVLRDTQGKVRNGWVVRHTADTIAMRSLAQQWPAEGYSPEADRKRFFRKQQNEQNISYVYQSLDATTEQLTDEQIIAKILQQYP